MMKFPLSVARLAFVQGVTVRSSIAPPDPCDHTYLVPHESSSVGAMEPELKIPCS